MKKRRWFRADVDPSETPIKDTLSSSQRTLADRLERGLNKIQDRTDTLMDQIAAKVWPKAQAGTNVQDRVRAALSRDAAIRDLIIAHSDERYQALDLQLGKVQDGVQSVTEVADQLRMVLEDSRDRVSAGTFPLDADGADLLRERLNGLQKYLASVIEYEAERDKAIGDWLQRMFKRGQGALRSETNRMVTELRARLDDSAGVTEETILASLHEQTRTLTYNLAAQEARIRLSIAETESEQASILKQQLKALEAIEADLTTAFDERLERLAEITQSAVSLAVDEVAERVGEKSAEAVTVGVRDLLAVMDRRFAWLEERIQDRLQGLEEALGIESSEAIVPHGERVISLTDELESARTSGNNS